MTPQPRSSISISRDGCLTAAGIVRIVGCGRRFRRDDQAGLRVAELLAADPPPNSAVTTTESPAADLPALLDDTHTLFIVDATRASAAFPAGSIRRINFRRNRALFRCNPGFDTHSAGVVTALSLADELQTLPSNVWVFVIAGVNFGYGEELSPLVERGVRGIAHRIREHCVHIARLEQTVGASHA